MANKFYAHKKHSFAKQQKGLVLFIALIALVAMSLAAAALVRSVDSGVLVAGNLAFKQSAIMSAETGIAQAYKYINDKGLAGLQTSDAANGYFADFNDTIALNDASTWTDANSFTVVTDIQDKSGNETRFILQRMCRTAGKEDADKCLVGTGDAVVSSKGGKSEGGGAGGGGYDGALGGSDAVVFRATVRVTGPKNTVSYLQAFIY
jgi:type IV pilus assembly protein PilX